MNPSRRCERRPAGSCRIVAAVRTGYAICSNRVASPYMTPINLVETRSLSLPVLTPSTNWRFLMSEQNNLEANKALMRRWFEEVWNQGRADAIPELFSRRWNCAWPVRRCQCPNERAGRISALSRAIPRSVSQHRGGRRRDDCGRRSRREPLQRARQTPGHSLGFAATMRRLNLPGWRSHASVTARSSKPGTTLTS